MYTVYPKMITIGNNGLSIVPIGLIPQQSNSCLLDQVKGNGGCHSYGQVNYKTTMPCNRCNFTPLYVQEICQAKANGCSMTYDKCVKKLTCTNCNTKSCL